MENICFDYLPSDFRTIIKVKKNGEEVWGNEYDYIDYHKRKGHVLEYRSVEDENAFLFFTLKKVHYKFRKRNDEIESESRGYATEFSHTLMSIVVYGAIGIAILFLFVLIFS